MELHRRRNALVGGAFLLALGVFVLLFVRMDGPLRIARAVLLGGGGTLVGGALVAHELRPFRFRVGADGLTVRHKGVNRLLRWDEVAAIIIDQPTPSVQVRSPSPHLLVVPAEGVDIGLPMTARSHAHDGACAVLVDLGDVKEPPEQVAGALARYGGHRFVNALQLRRDRFADPDFTVVLRGYDMPAVDELVRAGRDALAPGVLDGMRRIAAKATIDAKRTALPGAARGYDREQVDAYLRELSAALAKLDADPEASGAGS